MKAYDKLIPEGAYPSYYIFLETTPENIDVNIHPAKTEVKFENETEIFEILTAAVKESLGRNSFIPTIDFDHDTTREATAALNPPGHSTSLMRLSFRTRGLPGITPQSSLRRHRPPP